MKKPIYLIVIIISFSMVKPCNGQSFYLEAHIGHDLFEQKLKSLSNINGILIIPNTETLGEPLYGVKIGGNIRNKISWQIKANLGQSLYSFGVADLVESCNFCPITKVLTTGGRRFDLSISPRLKLFELGSFQVSGYAGLSFSKTKKPNPRYFSFNGYHLRTAEMLELINTSFGKSIFLYDIGLSLEYKRMALDISHSRQLSSSTSNGILFEEEFFQFVNKQSITALTIGYKLIKKDTY